jgi:hypothetical protein
MDHKLLCAALSATVTGLGSMMTWNMTVQQPSQPPRPSNPQPRPTQPGKDPAQTPRPNETPADDKTRQPGDKQRDVQPEQRDNQRDARNRVPRPFAFQSPQDEARFTQSSRRLVQMERRMERSNQDLLKRLGEARQLSPERQNAAFADVLQQLLKNQAELQQYLVHARSSWTGDVDLGDVSGDDDPFARQDNQDR